MKIRVELAIEVDPRKWDNTYGNGSKPSEVRTDVKAYILNTVQCSPGFEDSGATAELT
jgi:hypothetical protein